MPQYHRYKNSRQKCTIPPTFFGGQQVKINGGSDKERKRRYRDGLTYTRKTATGIYGDACREGDTNKAIGDCRL